MNAISPGVYARIIPLGSYVQQVPGDYAFIAFVSDKGPDNKLTFVTGQEDLHKKFGKPNFNKYGTWAQGEFVIDNYLTVAGSAYVIRVLPVDATYANVAYFITQKKHLHVESANLDVYFPLEGRYARLQNLRSPDNFKDVFDAVSDNPATQQTISVPDYMELIPEIGYVKNGQYFVLRVDTTGQNPQLVGRKVTESDETVVYALSGNELYEFDFDTFRFIDTGISVDSTTDVVPVTYVKNDDGTKLFKLGTDGSGNVILTEVSNWMLSDIYDIVKPLFMIYGTGRGDYYNNYRVAFEVPINAAFAEIAIDLKMQGQYYSQIRLPASFIPGELDETNSSAFIGDTVGMYFDDLSVYLDEEYMAQVNSEIMQKIFTKDGNGNYVIANVSDVDYLMQRPPNEPEAGKKYFILHNATDDWFQKDGYIATWNETNGTWDFSSTPVEMSEILVSGQDTYIHIGFGKVLKFDPYTFTAADVQYKKIELKEGSDGSIFDANGQINNSVVTQLIVQAYEGLIDPNVTNVDNYWFDLVFDAGYPKPVKDAIVSLVSEIRRDCVGLLDLGDCPTEEIAYQKRIQEYYYDTYYVALYEPFVNVYDPYSGRNKWVTPIYEVAKLIALNDKNNYQWYAVAGETRGAITDVNDLRFNPNHSERDVFYLNQINPIVKFKDSPVMVYGQLTAERVPHSTNNLNVVRTTLYIQRALKQYCKRKIFDFNDPITYHQMENDIKEFLKNIKDLRGLEYYDVKVTASDYEKKIKAARVKVRFKVTGIIEKFFLDLFVE